MKEQNNVTFTVQSSTLQATDISTRIGLTPDASWEIGATYGAFGAVRKQHGFSLESKLMQSAPLEDHVKEMLKRLAASAQKIGQLSAALDVVFACTIHSRRAPVLHFDRETVRWLASMNARLDIDTVVFADPPKPAAAPAPTGKPTRP